jgi:HME family heavy-metal exporter
VQKQPDADTVTLTAQSSGAGTELKQGLPRGWPSRACCSAGRLHRASVGNVEEALRDGAIMVAVVLFLFLLNVRTTVISLVAIPLSLLVTALVFHYFGLSINTMTLGGLAIAIGELVDDAVVGRRERPAPPEAEPQPPQPAAGAGGDCRAPAEVRSGIVYATVIVVLVFVPLFALPGIEGRLFTPLGVAYIVSILASMVVSVTLTPVLATTCCRA